MPFRTACNIVTAFYTLKFCQTQLPVSYSKLKQTFLQCSFLTVCEMTARSGSCSQLRLPIPHKISPITSLLHERIRKTSTMHKTLSYIWFWGTPFVIILREKLEGQRSASWLNRLRSLKFLLDA